MKRQKTMYQMKEEDKTPEKQLNEVEVRKLPGKEFRIMIVKMIQYLRKRMVEFTAVEQNKEKRMGDFPGGAVVKNPPANAGDMGSCPGPGRSHMPWSN